MSIVNQCVCLRKVATSALVVALAGAALASCAPQASSNAMPENGTEAAGVPEAPAVNTHSVIEGAVTEADIDQYCFDCHLHSDGASWNRETIDAAMVESMLPSMSEQDVTALADYFAAIEPAAPEAH